MIKPSHLLRAAVLGTVFTAMFTVGASAATLGAGTVTADALRLRDTPAAEGEILATASGGTSVVVLEDTGNGWYKVNFNTVEGYMSSEYLTVSTTADAALGYGLVDTDGSSLNMRAAAGTNYDTVASIPGGTVLELEGVDNGWYKVTYSGKTGYVSSDYITITTEPDVTETASSDLGAQIVAYAEEYLGTPYVLGGNGPNQFDCSGFTKYVYSHFGYTLNRTATDQLQNGVSVSKDELQPGDLVFFKYRTSKPVSHVGIYIGNGEFIHASTNRYVVQIDQMESGHYANVYVYARRIIG
ncbi:SH3 domain-containing C40 family peptidase [Intestinimonas butyriciproducens]|uniref:SH3 domain-containing protein n=1 Tax=Intestinimonas butyriciproducens TaxID=1297617 RepID=A0A2U1BD73_9FIRM|nr:SH3 domain-containing C40 family peptidase [Intestinimonas butyriciproducens]MBU5231005.1 C40 family peptidase [Intestinimonas butyriciproducens]MCI6362769.1 C40 family peptidase [Intestinimonas butyriciproducens]MCR1907383.1 C40 family peptidase [Intestinimonas butyriciproducens]MDB7861077.1 SH3 domain-containing C40 family peptidase [Intestinimonas butyriciproducens]MDB7863907.1 SH3 domain-containing C40 family peptidase [Intestinimonas butyriciproducens]